jgi:hypothetical protein
MNLNSQRESHHSWPTVLRLSLSVFRIERPRRCRILLARLAWQTCSFLLRCYASHTKFLTGSDQEAINEIANAHEQIITDALSGSRKAGVCLCKIAENGWGIPASPLQSWSWIRWAHDACNSVGDYTYDEQVIAIYRHLFSSLSATVRSEGDLWLDQLLRSRGVNNLHSRPILTVGAAGGDAGIYGVWTSGKWELSCRVADWEPYIVDESPIINESPRSSSWEKLLKKLDQYPWAFLHSIEVHPEFSKRIWLARQRRSKKSLMVDLNRALWKAKCGIRIFKRDQIDGPRFSLNRGI